MSDTTAANHYDAVILGSGQGGNPLAKALAQAGWRTAMIERKFVGGTCVNTGCTPTKTMVGSARVAYMSSRAEYLRHPCPGHRRQHGAHSRAQK